MKLNLYQQVYTLFSILEEHLNSLFYKQVIVKIRCRISNKAKETGCDESKNEEIINEIINTVTGNHPTHSSKEIQKMVDWLEQQKSIYLKI